MKRYATERTSAGWVVTDRVLGCPVSLEFPTRPEAARRAHELEDLVRVRSQPQQQPPQPQSQKSRPHEEPPIYVGGQRIDISVFGEDARRKIRDEIDELERDGSNEKSKRD